MFDWRLLVLGTGYTTGPWTYNSFHPYWLTCFLLHWLRGLSWTDLVAEVRSSHTTYSGGSQVSAVMDGIPGTKRRGCPSTACFHSHWWRNVYLSHPSFSLLPPLPFPPSHYLQVAPFSSHLVISASGLGSVLSLSLPPSFSLSFPLLFAWCSWMPSLWLMRTHTVITQIRN